jgi:hypothetical protein
MKGAGLPSVAAGATSVSLRDLRQSVQPAPLERDKAGRIVGAEGKPVVPASGRFLAAAETSVRAKPGAQAAKTGQLERGTRVDAVGTSGDGKWLAVRWGGREMGFVPREALLSLIDGQLIAPVHGTAKLPAGGSCSFVIRFTGKTPVEEDIIETADYDVDWRCDIDGRKLTFPGFMFITRRPSVGRQPDLPDRVDLLDVARDYDGGLFDGLPVSPRRLEGRVRRRLDQGTGAPPGCPRGGRQVGGGGAARRAHMAPPRGADVWKILAGETP